MVTRTDGGYLYDGELIISSDEVYRRFRSEYNKSLGKVSYQMLGKADHRKERVHGSDLIFSEGHIFAEYPEARIKAYMLGLSDGCYCKTVGIWDIPYEIEDFESWFDWAFRKGGNVLKMAGVRHKTGRTRREFKRRKR